MGKLKRSQIDLQIYRTFSAHVLPLSEAAFPVDSDDPPKTRSPWKTGPSRQTFRSVPLALGRTQPWQEPVPQAMEASRLNQVDTPETFCANVQVVSHMAIGPQANTESPDSSLSASASVTSPGLPRSPFSVITTVSTPTPLLRTASVRGSIHFTDRACSSPANPKRRSISLGPAPLPGTAPPPFWPARLSNNRPKGATPVPPPTTTRRPSGGSGKCRPSGPKTQTSSPSLTAASSSVPRPTGAMRKFTIPVAPPLAPVNTLNARGRKQRDLTAVSYTHLRAHE